MKLGHDRSQFEFAHAHLQLSVGEADLVDLAKSGDQMAYSELCKRHSHRVFMVLLRLTRNHEDAEDVLQESLLRAFTHLSQFDGRSAFRTWLTRIAINSAHMMHRKRRSRPEHSLDCLSEDRTWDQHQLADRALSAEEHLHRAERDSHIATAIQKLLVLLRIPLELHLSEAAPMDELATSLGISVPAAKSRLLRARARLRRAVLKRYSPGPKAIIGVNFPFDRTHYSTAPNPRQ